MREAVEGQENSRRFDPAVFRVSTLAYLVAGMGGIAGVTDVAGTPGVSGTVTDPSTCTN